MVLVVTLPEGKADPISGELIMRISVISVYSLSTSSDSVGSQCMACD